MKSLRFFCLLLLIVPVTFAADDLMARRDRELQDMQAHLDEIGATFYVGHNDFFDLPDDMRQIMSSGGIHSPDPGPDTPVWAPSKAELNAALSRDSFDWRNHNGHDWMTPVGYQDGCANCWAFASIGAVEANEKINANRYTIDPDYSEAYLTSCLVGDCNGHTIPTALDALRDDGVTGENCFPWIPQNPQPDCATSRCSSYLSDRHYIDGYTRIWPSTEANIKAAITAHGPVATWMSAGGSFQGYTGGVFNDCDDAGSGHFVVIAGWDDAQGCWFVKNSWDTSWGENGWFRIEKGSNCRGIEGEVYWIDPQYWPDLTASTHAGWDDTIVPRNTDGATTDNCTLTATLTGNSATTYLNFSEYNDSSKQSTYSSNKTKLDSAPWLSLWWSYIRANTTETMINQGPYTVRGGRHRIAIEYDEPDNMWELSETNNTWNRQFVWSPYTLISELGTIRNAPPAREYSPYNCDGFSFSNNAYYWTAVGILPANASDDYDVYLYNDYTGSDAGFSSSLASSTWGSGHSDFVLFDGNPGTNLTRWAGVTNYNGGTGQFAIQSDTSPDFYYSGDCPITGAIDANDVLDVWTVALYNSVNYGFRVEQTSGSLDIGISLYPGGPSASTYFGKSAYVAHANAAGAGEAETFEYNCTETGYYCLVIWKSTSTDYGASCNYAITFGVPTPTPTNTPTNTPTRTPTNTPTRTPTNTPTRTPTNTPTRTPTNSPTYIPTKTPTPTATPVAADVLLVDDDDNNPDVRDYYTQALDGLGVSYTVYDTNGSDNEPSVDYLNYYSTVIWFTGHNFSATCGPGPDTEAALSAWLDAAPGRCFLISSQDYHFARNTTVFMTDYLGADTISDDVSQTEITGVGTIFHDIGPDTLAFPFDNYSDTIIPDGVSEIAFDGNMDGAAIDKVTGTYTTSYWTFPLESIATLQEQMDALAPFLMHCGLLPTPTPTPTMTPTPTPVCIHNGDVDANGSFTAADAQLAFNIALGTYSPTLQEECSADCNGDGSVTAGDAQAIFNNVFGADNCADPLVFTRGKIGYSPKISQQGADEIHIALKKGAADNVLTAELDISNPDAAVDAFTLVVTYPAESMTFTSCERGELDPGWVQFDCVEIRPGIIRIAGYTAGDTPGGYSGITPGNAGSLVNLDFDITSSGFSGREIRIENLQDDLTTFTVI